MNPQSPSSVPVAGLGQLVEHAVELDLLALGRLEL